MSEVKDAIILAGGLGTRMLPASLYMPKETMPLIDTPILNHLIWEAAKSGVKRIHLVLSTRKRRILDDFISGKASFHDKVRRDLPNSAKSFGVQGIEIVPHVQKIPGGVADAISTAINQIEGAFLVLLGDMLIMDKHNAPDNSGPENASPCSSMLVSMFEKSRLPCVGVCRVKKEELSNYGVVEMDGNKIVSITENIMLSISSMVIISSIIGMIAILYSNLNIRRKEMALLRIVGASPKNIFTLMMFEAFLISFFSIIFAIILVQIASIIFFPILDRQFGIFLEQKLWNARNLYFLNLVLISSLLVSIFPSIQAFRKSINDGI